ncbi:MAG TPA: phosphotransferase [Candidatus Pacearchaeota archaeon]|nr:phosphotransferase [Candidatus Pacearchaeota archaeon]
MKTQESILKEKLGLSDKDVIKLKNFGRQTRNANYVLELNGDPSYFLKVNSEGIKKEIRMFDFLEKHKVFSTLMPVYKNEHIIILPFVKDLRDTEVRDNLDFILGYNNKALALDGSVFDNYKSDKLFENHYVKKFINRLDRHADLVRNFWKDIEGLKKFYGENPQECFESLPKILVHGDIQHKNLQSDSQGNIYLIDFEDVYFDSPSWDLSRPLMDLEPREIEDYKENYIEGVAIGNKDLLRKAINRDFVVRIITDSIGRQQRFGIEEAKTYLDIYRERYTNNLEALIYGGK